jgi:hypothetical protein
MDVSSGRQMVSGGESRPKMFVLSAGLAGPAAVGAAIMKVPLEITRWYKLLDPKLL